MSEEQDLELLKSAQAAVQKIEYRDGTVYYRMPNGSLVRSTPRAFKIRKNKTNQK
jgi:hypothetical protein